VSKKEAMNPVYTRTVDSGRRSHAPLTNSPRAKRAWLRAEYIAAAMVVIAIVGVVVLAWPR
jgi:hypothetical protein